MKIIKPITFQFFSQLCICFFILIFQISNAHSEDLYEIFTLAMSQDSGMQTAQARHQAEIQARPIARANLLPQIRLEANTTDVRQDTKGETFGVNGREVDFNDYGYTLDITQMLYNREFYVQLKQAKNTVAKAQLDLDKAKQDLIIRTAETYFNLLSSQDNLSYASSEKKAISHQLEQAKNRYDVGSSSITDVKEAQASYDLAIAQEIDAQNKFQLAIDTLEVIVNRNIDFITPLSDRIQLELPSPNDIDQWEDMALQHNLSLLSNEYTTKIAQQDIQLIKAKHLPTINIVASHSDTDTGGISGSREFEDSRIGIELDMPLFLGGRTYYQTKEANYKYQSISHQYEKERRETSRTTRNAFLNVVASISKEHAFKQALESTQSAADAAAAGFDAGTRTSVDVLIALRETYLAKSNFAKSRYDYLINMLRLKQAAGSLSTNDLEQVNNWLK